MVEIGTHNDMIALLEECLEGVRAGKVDILGLVTISQESYVRNAVLKEGASLISLLGAIDKLHSDISHFESELQAKNEEAIQLMMESLDGTKPH